MPVIDIQWKGHRDGYARGVLTEAGDIYVWPEFEQTHGSRLRDLNLTYEQVWCFSISAQAKGERFAGPYRLEMYELDERGAKAVLAAIPNIDPPMLWNEAAA